MSHSTAHTHHRRLVAAFATLDAIRPDSSVDTPRLEVARELLAMDPTALDPSWVQQCDEDVRWSIRNIKRYARHVLARFARREERGDDKFPKPTAQVLEDLHRAASVDY